MWIIALWMLGACGQPRTCREVREACGCEQLCVSEREARRIERSPQCDIGCIRDTSSPDPEPQVCELVGDQCQFITPQ